MSKAFRPPLRFPRLRFQVNLFLLVAALVVVSFLVLVAYKQGWFIQRTTIHFVTADAIGINKGMPVKLYGLTIGSVSEMEIGDDGVLVKLQVMTQYVPRIPRGSRARFGREHGVVGASVIEIVPPLRGAESLTPLADNEAIPFERSRGITEIVEDFRRQATPALNELKETLSRFNRSGDDLNASAAVLRAEIERLPETHTAFRDTLGNANRAAIRADTTFESARRAADSVERDVPVVAGKLAVTLDSINAAAQQLRETTLDSINAAAQQLRETTRQTGETAEDALRRTGALMDQGESVAREAREVVGASRRVWPLSGAFKDVPDATLPVDSFEGRSTLPPR
jgi:phospholipid/cholesterol/gamma-HCH transport system substrate-binding protein